MSAGKRVSRPGHDLALAHGPCRLPRNLAGRARAFISGYFSPSSSPGAPRRPLPSPCQPPRALDLPAISLACPDHPPSIRSSKPPARFDMPPGSRTRTPDLVRQTFRTFDKPPERSTSAPRLRPLASIQLDTPRRGFDAMARLAHAAVPRLLATNGPVRAAVEALDTHDVAVDRLFVGDRREVSWRRGSSSSSIHRRAPSGRAPLDVPERSPPSPTG